MSALFYSFGLFYDPVCMHKPFDFLSVSPTDNYMMVADGMLQQVGPQIDIQSDLRATEMVAIRHFDGRCLGDEITVKLGTSPFK